MPEIVDPKPAIEETLRRLAAEWEPRIALLQMAIAEAAPDAVRARKRELRHAKREYAAARRAVRGLRRPGVAW